MANSNQDIFQDNAAAKANFYLPTAPEILKAAPIEFRADFRLLIRQMYDGADKRLVKPVRPGSHEYRSPMEQITIRDAIIEAGNMPLQKPDQAMVFFKSLIEAGLRGMPEIFSEMAASPIRSRRHCLKPLHHCKCVRQGDKRWQEL